MSKKSRSKVKSRMISLIVFVLLACLAVYIYHGLQTPLTVTTYNYHNKKIPTGIFPIIRLYRFLTSTAKISAKTSQN